MNDTGPERLNSCGCCEDEERTPVVYNDPALEALRYRIGTHGEFLERMLRMIPRTAFGPLPALTRPLTRFTARSTDDPTVALLDACACVFDIVTFYQERIANEGFLR